MEGGGEDGKSGSIYLHCDPTASHYLKLLMDEVFGKENFRNEIVWLRRTEKHNLAKKHMGRIHDVIFYFARSSDTKYIKQHTPYEKEYLEKHYKDQDEIGRYTTMPCTNEAGGNRPYDFKGITRAWRFSPERMEEMYQKGLLVQKKPESPFRYKKYLEEAKGVPIQDVWADVPAVRGKESLGYPTQKPLALLERIIKASSGSGDMILDPFCGCATACVAAEKLGRQWIGIDISEKAADLVKHRINKELGVLLFKPIHRFDVPLDRGGERSKNIKHILYGMQEGKCTGCLHHFPFQNFEVDHIIPKSKGGADVDENLQLLCGYCNRVKGDRTQEYLVSQVRRTA